ncbi:hypothetical protein [Rossellomorea aquimaris]|uniref:Uncharacterized protein n=1 Tax=Rossellomorea aquimaris TaxID=189382 RepID=A0A1J6W5V3_9BACI|nr:hypothetical protein [Rossellomorea aquimaris]OIU72954.1 hypothetical protein BHE18_21815 [Rossellomorea aquimaris]
MIVVNDMGFLLDVRFDKWPVGLISGVSAVVKTGFDNISAKIPPPPSPPKKRLKPSTQSLTMNLAQNLKMTQKIFSKKEFNKLKKPSI